jgi:hypothetical protein
MKGETLMLKLNASYSKKVPADEKFSSQSYLACVEVELPTGQTTAQLQQKIHETFELVKASVEDEIAGQTAPVSPGQQQRSERPSGASNSKATNKQIQFILRLGQERKKGLADLNAIADEQFKAATIYELTKRDASRMVDQLKMAA